MIIGVTGANGYIGKALVKAGAVPLQADVVFPDEIEREISKTKPDVILHLAAKSDPEFCQNPLNGVAVGNINLSGAYNVMYRASQCGIPCVLMSTGQIWKGGFWEGEHRENDKHSPPVNVYGISKLAAEAVVKNLFPEYGKIVRSSYVFDKSRVEPKIKALQRGETLSEPVFIRRSFIYLEDIVRLLVEYCERIAEMPTILHLAGRQTVSHYDFIREVAKQYTLDRKLVIPRKTESKEFAPRPSNAGLDTSLARSLGFRIPDYKEGIVRMKSEI